MDNAEQMETIAALEVRDRRDGEGRRPRRPTPIHEKLAADCKDKVDVLVIDVVKGYMQ